MTSCPFCMAEIPAEARKCKHCGEWVEPGAKGASRYDFGEKSFMAALLGFCLPPLSVVALALGIAALVRRNPSDSRGWASAGACLGGVAVLGWTGYVLTLLYLHLSDGGRAR